MPDSNFIFRRLVMLIVISAGAAAILAFLIGLLIRIQVKGEADDAESARMLQLCVDHGGDVLRRGDSFINADQRTRISYTYCIKFTAEGEKVKGIVVHKSANGVVTTDWRN